MKVLNAGDTMLSNADVLDWIRRKRAQHAREDADAQSRNLSTPIRPQNYMRILTKTERELKHDHYPYVKNPSIYAGENRGPGLERFALEVENAVMDHLEEKWKKRLAKMSVAKRVEKFAPEQQKKVLRETELLMVFNHAPTSVDMLKPMIEEVDGRFNDEELQVMVDVIARVLRGEERGGLDVEMG